MNHIKKLYLVRHADSDWNHPGVSDFDRPLNHRGLQDAPKMGAHLRAQNIQLDELLCSSAQRARQTAGLLATELGFPLESIRYTDKIYEASPRTLFEQLTAIDDACKSVMMVGHNPGMSDLASTLAGNYLPAMPPCAVVSFSFTEEHWKNISAAQMTLLHLDYPGKNGAV